MKEILVIRAMEVARLDEEKLKALHEREKQRGSIVPGWNIQQLYGLQSLKDRYLIPKKEDAFQQHNERVWTLLKENNLLKVEGDGNLISGDLAAIHSFDWGIWRRRECLDFNYQGPGKTGSLKDVVREFRESRMNGEVQSKEESWWGR